MTRGGREIYVARGFLVTFFIALPFETQERLVPGDPVFLEGDHGLVKYRERLVGDIARKGHEIVDRRFHSREAFRIPTIFGDVPTLLDRDLDRLVSPVEGLLRVLLRAEGITDSIVQRDYFILHPQGFGQAPVENLGDLGGRLSRREGTQKGEVAVAEPVDGALRRRRSLGKLFSRGFEDIFGKGVAEDGGEFAEITYGHEAQKVAAFLGQRFPERQYGAQPRHGIVDHIGYQLVVVVMHLTARHIAHDPQHEKGRVHCEGSAERKVAMPHRGSADEEGEAREGDDDHGVSEPIPVLPPENEGVEDRGHDQKDNYIGLVATGRLSAQQIRKRIEREHDGADSVHGAGRGPYGE